MTAKRVVEQHHETFEGIRQSDAEGNEFWIARQLAKVLEYSEYRHFQPVIERAKESCRNSGHVVEDHFEDVLDMVDIGSGAKRQIADIRLSRYACYLIVQNGDPSKPVIANGQTYFALQTRRQELSDNETFARLSENDKRLAIRNELAEHNKHLAAAAKDAGVETPLFLCTVPLIVQGKTIGVINLADRSDPENFGDADLELLMAIANQLAVSIENAKLHELAITDGLTGLFIHRYFQIKLDDEMKAARRYDTPLSLIIFDIDHFKKFNDTFGHQQGDRVLKETARLVKESVRGTDLACRYGGEEFALILPHTTAEQAMIFAERLRKRIAANEMRCEETKMQVTISIGIAEFPRMASDKTSLIKKADQALYSCKNKGRNCVQIFSDDMA